MLYKMHNYKKTPVNFFGNKIVKAAALSSLLVFSNAYATGLGKLTVLSSLGQPLKAEIELTSVNKEDVASLVPKISSLETFKQANIDFNPALLNLKFAVVPKGNGYVIKVTSTQPMNEPWVDFLLEMKAESGRLVREYTFLLDPAELMTGQAAQVAVPAPVISAIKPSVPVTSSLEIRRELETSPQRGEQVKKTDTSVSSGTRTTQNSGEYKVRSGDTLMKIASQHLNGVSLDQMLVGIYQANPDAFVGNNMNRLKAGQVLSIPTSSDLQNVSNSEARSIISAHTSDFNAYRNRLAGQVNRVPQEKNETIKQTSSNAITTKVRESTTGVNSSVDKLKLSKLERVNDAQDKNAKRISEEDRLAKEKALQEANARVKELEKNVIELNKLLAVPTKSAVVQAPVVNKVAEKPAEPKPVEVKKSAPEVIRDVASSSAIAAAASSARTSVASTNTRPVVRPKKPAPPAPPVEESGWFDNPYILPVSGLLLALLAAFGFYSSRKKRAAHQFEDSILTGSSLKANSMFGSTGGQSVDTNNSVFNSNFAPSASQLDANEVDPVAEADVYIAYGRDSQAEEILREALRNQPERHAVRLKLLEIYYARKDQKSFDLLAGEMYGMTRGEGDDWAQAASMGLSLDPSNPLYAGASPQAETYLPGISLPTQPLEDFETDALLDTGLSPDMLDSISIIDIASGHSDHSIHIPDESMSTKQPLEDSFDIDGLDFDLDIDDSSLNLEQDALTIPEISDTATKADEVESIPSIDFSSIDFDLGGDQSSNLVQEENIQNEDDLQSLSTSSMIDSLDLNSSIEGNHLNVETSSLDIEDSLHTSKVGSVDIEDLSFDTDEKELNQMEIESSTGIYNAEMATKLDLAVAYQEIGDREGARELLDEVIKGGSSDQIEKAKEMLKQIS